MKYMTSYTKPLFLILVLLILFAPAVSVFAQTTPPRALEITYPVLPGEDGNLELGPDTGLPDYVRYLFRFALAITGFIILYVMISAGLDYVMSSGNAEKLLTAKKGILAGFLGALILIGAFLLFNTINPDLTNLKPIADLEAIEPIIIPGIYLCNYSPSGVQSLISTYRNLRADLDDRVEAVKKMKDIMSSKDGSENCYRVKFSANLTAKDITLTKTKTVFAIPKRTTNTDLDDSPTEWWEYNYGIIFHEKDNWKGKCSLNRLMGTYISDIRNNSFSATSTPFSEFNTAKSVTLFERPTVGITSVNTGVGLFQCLDHSRTKNCPPGVATGGFASFPTGGGNYSGYITEVSRSILNGHNLAGSDGTTPSPPPYGSWGGVTLPTTYTEAQRIPGARSVLIDPPNGAFFAIMFSEPGYVGKTCEVISKSDNNLLDQPIGQCGSNCKGKISSEEEEFLRDCVPCLKSMIVIKGNVIY